ncbi:MAG TPA: hypothetical protein DCZ07_13460 [Alphaproteobacteria bacterium]|nr:hypothetical protein [Alphaproteobacteria bacterium]
MPEYSVLRGRRNPEAKGPHIRATNGRRIVSNTGTILVIKSHGQRLGAAQMQIALRKGYFDIVLV